MKRFAAGFVVGTVVLVLGVVGYLELGLAEIRADVSPTGWTGKFLYTAVHAAVRREAPVRQSPLPANEQVLIAGGKLYLNDCVGCHGEPGKPASKFGATFYPPAPQLAQMATQYSVAEIFWIAKHGLRRTGMSAEGSWYSDEDLWRLTAFIHEMTKLPPGVMEGVRLANAPQSADK